MVLTGLDLGAWLTKSGAVVVVYEYDEVTQVFLGFVVHPMREVRYGKDGRLVSCCFLPGESQTVEHEQKLHDALHLDRKLGDVDAIITVNQVEWEKSYAGEAALAPARRQDSAGAGIYDEQPPLVNTYADRTLNASRLLRDVVESDSAQSQVVALTEYYFYVVTPESDWTIRGTHFEWDGDSVSVFLIDECVALVRGATSCVRDTNPRPVKPVATMDDLCPLGDTLDHLFRIVNCDIGSGPVTDAVKACRERFGNLVKHLRG